MRACIYKDTCTHSSRAHEIFHPDHPDRVREYLGFLGIAHPDRGQSGQGQRDGPAPNRPPRATKRTAHTHRRRTTPLSVPYRRRCGNEGPQHQPAASSQRGGQGLRYGCEVQQRSETLDEYNAPCPPLMLLPAPRPISCGWRAAALHPLQQVRRRDPEVAARKRRKKFAAVFPPGCSPCAIASRPCRQKVLRPVMSRLMPHDPDLGPIVP